MPRAAVYPMFKVKNLRKTTGCAHYRGLSASSETARKCAVNGCKNRGDQACHVISANQSASSGIRKIVYMCRSHNKRRGTLELRRTAKCWELLDCDCGED